MNPLIRDLACNLLAALTPQGWAMMLVSISVVLGLVSYCLYRVLTLPPVDVQDIKGPLEIDTRDTTDAD
ncbi:MAG: hypothetical protein KDA44_21480 [Planctomycetales bacterium]|nr:hypothetical protein [Planctomycetales bacterium]